jgi:1-acyl-sn-glycerol-3-phosphate acyltransferase
MKWLRVIWRLIVFVPLMAGFFLTYLTGRLVTGPWPVVQTRWRNFIFRTWCQAILRVLGADVEVSGEPPEAPFYLVSNHLSYVDIVLLAGRLDAVFVAKSEVADWPLLGTICREIGTIFVDRSSRRDIPRVMEQLERTLAGGQGVVLFAEGTSTRGARVMPFRPSLLETAVRSGHPVSYVAITYSTPEGFESAHTAVCWWGGRDFAGHLINLLTLPHFRASLVFGDERFLDDDRKRLAEKLWRAVDHRFEPVVSLEGECV